MSPVEQWKNGDNSPKGEFLIIFFLNLPYVKPPYNLETLPAGGGNWYSTRLKASAGTPYRLVPAHFYPWL